ncbi:MAG: hypothetical protein H6819_03505 [Phycisphaerales bacterium]|nr:hypothetical protein [Phycisphaerales bacterium]MCB9856263.1 hypothetical protein [Phycisphaerales bacterium]MCB9863298.1 hypothetical protein [Phycisphaerales bacterium]
MSRSAGLLLNLLIPGAGLVSIRREWLGLALALLFAVGVNIWIAGQWIAPLAVPRWLSFLALGMGIADWLAAQTLFVHLARRHDAIQTEVDSLLSQAKRDASENDLDTALAVLEAATALDGERPDVLAAEADLLDACGKPAEARRLRRRILSIAPSSEWAAAAEKSLATERSQASDFIEP